MSESTSAPMDGATDSPELTEGFTDDALDQGNEQEALATPDEGEEDDFLQDKVKLKVNGKTTEHSMSEVVKMAQQYQATNIKLEQAKQEVQQAKQMQGQLHSQQEAIKAILQVLQKGDIDTIADFVAEHLQAGDRFNQAIIQYALKQYELAKLPPELREAEANKKLLARMRKEAEDRQRVDQQRAYEFKVNQWTDYLNTELPKAMETVGLPNTDWVRDQVIQTWRVALENGQTPTAKAVAQFVQQRLKQANINLQTQQAGPVRQRATQQSVAAGRQRLNGADKQPQEQYISWSDWVKNRAH